MMRLLRGKRGRIVLLLAVAAAGALASDCNSSSLKRERDRSSFWRREHQKRFGAELTLVVPKGQAVRLYENLSALQFHGLKRSPPGVHPLVKPGPLLNPDNATNVIGGRRGDCILLVEQPAGDSPRDPRSSDDTGRPVSISVNGDPGHLALVNIYSDGDGLMRVEAESDTERPDYFVWIVNTVRLKYE